MSVIRVGSTSSYADGWEQIFGGGKAATRKTAAKRMAKKKPAAAKKPAARKAAKKAKSRTR